MRYEYDNGVLTWLRDHRFAAGLVLVTAVVLGVFLMWWDDDWDDD